MGLLCDVVLVGQSLGTQPALEFARRHPSRVRGVVLSGAVGGLRGPVLDARLAERTAELERLRGRLAHQREHPTDPAPAVDGTPDHSIDAALTAVDRASTRPDLADLRRYVETSVPIDVDSAAQILAPVLILAGERDPLTDEELAEADRILPNAEWHRIAGAGHGSHADRPDAYNAHLDRFLERLLPVR